MSVRHFVAARRADAEAAGAHAKTAATASTPARPTAGATAGAAATTHTASSGRYHVGPPSQATFDLAIIW